MQGGTEGGIVRKEMKAGLGLERRTGSWRKGKRLQDPEQSH